MRLEVECVAAFSNLCFSCRVTPCTCGDDVVDELGIGNSPAVLTELAASKFTASEFEFEASQMASRMASEMADDMLPGLLARGSLATGIFSSLN